MSKTFPLHKQKVGDSTCGPSCLVAIYESLGEKVDKQTILNELNISDSDYTYLPQIARHMLKRNLEIKLISPNSYVFSPEWAQLSREQVITELRDWIVLNAKNEWLLTAIHSLFFLEEGGTVEITDLTTELLDSHLDAGWSLLCLVEPSWLWGKRKIAKKAEYDSVRGNADGHFIVVYDRTETEYIISDPYPTSLPGKEHTYQVDKARLITATYLRGASIAAVRSK